MSKSLLCAATCVALLLGALPAQADLYSAKAAYQKGDFPSAFEQFKELAELGQPEAQLDVALMYERGEGVALSNTFAHAWAALASANGEERAQAVRDQLEARLTPTSLQVSADLQAKFSQKALDARLMPRILNGKQFDNRDPAHLLKTAFPDYPLDANRRGIQGDVYVEFVVAPDGRARTPRILYSLPKDVFDEAVIGSVMHSSFLPGRINGQPVATPMSIFYRFKAQYAASEYAGLERRVADTLRKANNGDPAAQMLYGMMIAGFRSSTRLTIRRCRGF